MNALRILIADDESLRLMSLREQLEKLGHRVVAEASDGRSAVELARDLRPDIAIMDIKMPGMDGIEAADKIMHERPIPIILLTAYSEKDLAERAAQAQVAAYLMKPVSENDLLPAIALAISRFTEFQQLHKEVDDLRDALETRKLVERAKGILMKRYGIGEQEAFERIHSQSRSLRKTMRELAEAIILAEGI